jgi:2-amino-4-hydroxy-6-hydroxymethyldihydropteridine diphosphokinase
MNRPAEAGWLEAAASGVLPEWTRAKPTRRAHMARVAALMDEWAGALQLAQTDRMRWRAAGWLHDTLRDADQESLRSEVGAPFDTLPTPFLHGPASAVRLERAGARDTEVLDAIRYHTLGDAALGQLGLALIAADYLEPGRPAHTLWRSTLRARMPHAFHAVLIEVVRDKLRRGLDRSHPLRSEMIGLWNRLTSDAYAS